MMFVCFVELSSYPKASKAEAELVRRPPGRAPPG